MAGQVTVKHWGNSQGIRLSMDVLRRANIQVNDTLQVEAADNMLILKKAFPHRTFEERLAEYDGRIQVQDFEWGEPAGKELV